MLTVVPLTLTAARRHVHQHHSHLERPQGGLCAVGVADDGQLACVAILSLPRARLLNGKAAEVIRVASDGTRHAASMCLAAITRAGLALGYTRLVSSTLLGEAGTSYRAAGWRPVAIGGGGEWSRDGRERDAAMQPGAKVRWETGPTAAWTTMNAEDLADVDAFVRESVGRVVLSGRGETMPLFRESA